MKASLAVLAVLLGVAYGSGHWGYDDTNGPDTWCESYSLCCLTSQSPINIDTTSTVAQTFESLVFTGYDDTSATLTLANNGHSAKLSTSTVPSISGGGLDETFHFAQLHFHWGSNSSVGSEHTVDDHQYPAEIHFVHWRNSMASFDAASTATGGLAIVGVFLEVSAEDNPAFDSIATGLESITYNGESTTLTSFALNDILPADTSDFYRYEGSLTTPTCDQSGIWTVLATPVSISESQLAKFRSLYFNAEGETDEQMVNNYRPVQPLNGRTVYVSATDSTSAAAETSTSAAAESSTSAAATSTSAAATTTASSNIFKRFFQAVFRG